MAIQGLEFDRPTLVDGGHEQKAIVNTASGKQPVNAPTVEDIKRIAKGEAETEGDKSYTKAESDAKFLSKTDAASTYYTKAESDERYSGKLYNHQILLVDASDNNVTINVICNQSTAFESISQILSAVGFRLVGLGCLVYETSADEEYAGAVDTIFTGMSIIKVAYKTTYVSFGENDGATVYSDKVTAL